MPRGPRASDAEKLKLRGGKRSPGKSWKVTGDSRRLKCPTWLAKGARKEFRELVRILGPEGQAVLGREDRATLTVLAEAIEEHRQAAKAIASEGAVIHVPKGDDIVPMANPWVRIRDQACNRIRACVSDLGIRLIDRKLRTGDGRTVESSGDATLTSLDAWKRKHGRG